MSTMDSRNRIFYLDAIRAFAIIAILVVHTLDYYWDTRTELFSKMYFGSAALFFMTSGALIFPITRPGAFIRRRLSSYLPQFVIWTVAYALMGYWLWDGDYLLGKQLLWMLYTPTWSAGWFLYALTGLYLFAPFISPWLASASKRSVEWFLLAWIIAGTVPLAAVQTPFTTSETLFAPFYGFLGFMVAGHYLARWPLFSRPRKERVAFFAGTILIGVLFAVRAFVTAWRWGFAETLDYDLSLNVMAMCLLWFAVFQSFRHAPAFIARAITLVSICSLEIYLCHVAWLDYLIIPLGTDLWVAIIMTLLLSVLTAVALRRISSCIRRLFHLKFH